MFFRLNGEWDRRNQRTTGRSWQIFFHKLFTKLTLVESCARKRWRRSQNLVTWSGRYARYSNWHECARSKYLVQEKGLHYNDGWVMSRSNSNGDLAQVFGDASHPENFFSGTHYYRLSKSQDCVDVYPWFFLGDGKDLIGFGFQLLGPATRSTDREWFENIPIAGIQVSEISVTPFGCTYRLLFAWISRLFITGILIFLFQFAIPDVPDCLLQEIADVGLISLHFWLSKNVTIFSCNSWSSGLIRLPDRDMYICDYP